MIQKCNSNLESWIMFDQHEISVADSGNFTRACAIFHDFHQIIIKASTVFAGFVRYFV